MSSKLITRTTVDRSGNRYCGPLVLAALLGCTTAEAAAKVRAACGHGHTIKGMTNNELLKTLIAGGYSVTELNVSKHYVEARNPGEPSGVVNFRSNNWEIRMGATIQKGVRLWQPPEGFNLTSQFTPVKHVGPTLAAWLRTRPDKSATYIINVTGHYVLISGRKFVDTGTRGEWVNIGKAPHRRARVVKVWRVER
jgi:hypothetical protein